MRNALIAVFLLAAPAAAEDIKSGDVLDNDLAMKTDVMVRDGQMMTIGPDGHLMTMAPSAARKKEMETAISAHGAEVRTPMIFMMRDGKLYRMDDMKASDGTPMSQQALTGK